MNEGGLFWSKNLLIWVPNEDVKLITVVGKGIKLPKIENPTKEDVDYYHKMFIANLT